MSDKTIEKIVQTGIISIAILIGTIVIVLASPSCSITIHSKQENK